MTATKRSRLAGSLAGRLARSAGDRQPSTTVACAGPQLTAFPALPAGRTARLVQAVIIALLATVAVAAFAPLGARAGLLGRVQLRARRRLGRWIHWRELRRLPRLRRRLALGHEDLRRSPRRQPHVQRRHQLLGLHRARGHQITGLDWHGNKFYGFTSAGYFGGGWAFQTGMYGDNWRQVDGNAYCYTDNYGACFSGDGISGNARSVYSEVRNMNDAGVMFYTSCHTAPNWCPTNSDGQPGHSYTRAALVLNNGRVHLRDDWDPNIKGVGGSIDPRRLAPR